MSEQYLIKLSSNEITTDGKNLAEVKQKQVDAALLQSNGKQTREEIEKLINIPSKRDNEKEILTVLLQHAYKTAVRPQDFYLIGEIDAMIQQATDSFLINIDEWKKYFQDQFENTIEDLASRKMVQIADGRNLDPFPYYWKNCKEMLRQLYAPELNKAVNDGKSQDIKNS